MLYEQKLKSDEREGAYHHRAHRARYWARRVFWLAAFAALFGIWQDRALAPPVHDGMKRVAGNVVYAFENSDQVRAKLHSFFGGNGKTSLQQQYDPITRWLLKWKDA